MQPMFLELFNMIKLRVAFAAVAIATAATANAGGINTNSNMSVAFNRTLSRDGAIGIDGVYFNPAGVAFLPNGAHLSLNWQFIWQSRTINNEYPLFARNLDNASNTRKFTGHALAPVFPSFQFAYNWDKVSFQAGFGVTGGGGKCTFDNGLGSFERIVSETALAATGLAQTVDAAIGPGVRMFTSDAGFGSEGKYRATSYMRGRQYYYGLSLGAAYKINTDLSVFAGVRGVYALANYYGYVRNIQVGNTALYTVLDPSKTNSADIELNCDQSGTGFTPIIGVDYKTGRWNFAAKYEFKTRLRMKNSAVNSFPSIGVVEQNGQLTGNLVNNLKGRIQAVLQQQMIQQGMSEAAAQTAAAAKAQSVMSNARVQGTMNVLKQKFDEALEEATGEFTDGTSVPADLPGILALGVGFKPTDKWNLTTGFHYYFDKQATAYKHKEDKLSRGTIECSFGAEYKATDKITVSAGYQNTSYGTTTEYMDDKSYVVSSNSVGCGVQFQLSSKMKLNLAYLHTFYGTEKTKITAPNTGLAYTANYTRNNNALGVSLDIDL